jgi:hypothetical protein
LYRHKCMFWFKPECALHASLKKLQHKNYSIIMDKQTTLVAA